MIAGMFGGSGFVASCREVLSNSDLSPRVVHSTADIASSAAFDSVMMALNLEYVRPGHPLKADDEVAFSPPVTRG